MLKRFLLGSILLTWSYLALGQTTPTARYNTVADMIAAPVTTTANTKISALVTGRLTANDGGGGTFFFVPGSTASTNLGTIFPSTGAPGRWFREYSGPLNVFWFGAVGNGTSQTAEIKNAYDTIDKVTGGTLFFPPGNFKFNLAVTNANISIVVDSTFKPDTSVLTNYWQPDDPTLAVLRVGDGNRLARSFTLSGGSFRSVVPGAGNVGLELAGGAYDGGYYDCSFFGFKTNILIRASGTSSTTKNVFIRGTSQAGNVDNSRGLYIAAPTDPTFTVGTTFIGYTFNSQLGGVNTAVLELDGTDLNYVGGRIDFLSGSPMMFSRSSGLSFAINPVIRCSTVIFDGSSTYPIVKATYSNANRIQAYVRGDYTFNGQAEMFDGTVLQQAVCQSALSEEGGHILAPYIQGRMHFVPASGQTTNNLSKIIYDDGFDFRTVNTNGNLIMQATTNLHLGYPGTNYMTINSSLIQLSNAVVVLPPSSDAVSTDVPNPASVMIHTPSPTDSTNVMMLFDIYANTTNEWGTVDFGINTVAGGNLTSRLVHSASYNTRRGTFFGFTTHTDQTNTWNRPFLMNPTGDVLASDGQFFWNGSLYRLGLGTDAPATKLHVVGDEIRFTGGNGLVSARIMDGGSFDQGQLQLNANGSAAIFLNSITGGNSYNIAGPMGFGDSTPETQVDVQSTTTPQFRVSYDDSNYTPFSTSSGGDLTISPTGLDTTITGRLFVTSPGVGLTNVTGAGLTGNYFPGSNVTFATNGTQVTIAASGGGGITGVGANLSDLLSVSGSDLVADDQGATVLWGWDDSLNSSAPFVADSPVYIDAGTRSFGVTTGLGLTNSAGTLQANLAAGTGINLSTSGTQITIEATGSGGAANDTAVFTKTGIADGAIEPVADLACAAGAFVGGKIEYTVYSTDSTDYLLRTGTISFSAINKAGTIDVSYTDSTGNQSGGIFTINVTMVSGSNKITFTVEPNGLLGWTGSWSVNYKIINLNNAAVTNL